MNRKDEELLREPILNFLMKYMKKKKLNKTEMATELGLKRSTFCDFLNGVSTRKTGKNLIYEFVRQHGGEDLFKQQRLESVGIDVNINGKEKPQISQDRLQMLLTQIKSAADMIISPMKEIANAGVGDRVAFRQLLRLELDQIRILSSALASEQMLANVKKELCKDKVP